MLSMCCQCVSLEFLFIFDSVSFMCVCVFLDLGYLYPNMNRVKLIVRGEDIDGERRIRNRNSTGCSDKEDSQS